MARKRILGTLAPLAVFAALLMAWQPGALAVPLSQQVNVAMLDNRFDPPTLTVQVGTTVVWTNTGVNPHTSTADGGQWDSGIRNSGQNYSRTFDAPGTYPYGCTLHRAPPLNMVGTITVVAAAQPTATPVPPTATSAAATATTTPTRAPATATPIPATATPTRAAATATPTLAPAPAAPTPPPAAPTPTPAPPKPIATDVPTQPPPGALPTSGDQVVPPWVMLLAGMAVMVGLAAREAFGD